MQMGLVIQQLHISFGVEDLIPNIKKACAAGAIVAGTNDEPTIEKIEEIAQLVEVNPR